MTDPEPNPMRARREPPRFRRVAVRRVETLSPRLVRITVTGPDLQGFAVDEPAASVRLLLPSAPGRELVVPTWQGNEFLLPDGRRPAIRTFTPRRFDPVLLELDIDAVIHGEGIASRWAATAAPGADTAISGPGRGYEIDPEATAMLLGGDESAIPAIGQLLEVLPETIDVTVHVEVAAPDARIALPEHPRASITWHDLAPDAPAGDALVEAIRTAVLRDDELVWAAGEAAAMQRIRRYLFDERAVPRNRTTIRGYWKHGRAGAGES